MVLFVAMAQYVHTEMSNFLGWITQKDLVKFTHHMVLFFPTHPLSPSLIFFASLQFFACVGTQCLYNKWRGISRLGSYSRGLWGWGSLKEQVALTKSKVLIFALL